MINKNERIFIAGATGMVGSAIKRAFVKENSEVNGSNHILLTPSRKELDLFDLVAVKNWFLKNKPTIVIIAAAKVGGIYSNMVYPADFLIKNLKIQTNLIESAYLK